MNLYPTTERMPLKVYIHIGAPKTGTSAIQSHINTNCRWLAERGIYVPKAGYLSSYGHCKLFSKSELGPGLARLMPFLPEDGELDELGREISNCKELNCTTVLLTWEGFSLIDQQLISKLGRCLGECEIDVLSYVREQAKLYQSTVLQFIETNNGFARSFFPPPEFNSIEFRDYLNFHELLTSWKATLPEGTGIRSRVYNRELLNGGNIVLDFIDFIGLKYSSGFCLQRESVNTSIDYSAAAMLAVFETVGANPAQREQLVHAFTQAGRYSNTSTSEFLSQETVTKITEHFKLSNRELIRDYPPENCDQSLAEHYLAGLQRSKELDVDPVIEFCRSVLSALSSSSAYLWHGQPLSGHTLRRITGGSSSGWGPSDVKGIWSGGGKSELIFRIPEVDLKEGPSHLELKFDGIYTKGNQLTRIHGHGLSEQLDLRKGKLCIPIDNRISDGVIKLMLEHQRTTLSGDPEINRSDNKKTYKLRSLSYNFCC